MSVYDNYYHGRAEISQDTVTHYSEPIINLISKIAVITIDCIYRQIFMDIALFIRLALSLIDQKWTKTGLH